MYTLKICTSFSVVYYLGIIVLLVVLNYLFHSGHSVVSGTYHGMRKQNTLAGPTQCTMDIYIHMHGKPTSMYNILQTVEVTGEPGGHDTNIHKNSTGFF